MIGSRLLDRYELVAELGRGGMAVVYRARDPRLGREVAVKVMDPSCSSTVGIERFRREAQLVARLDHPGIVPIYDFGRQGEALFFVMPIAEGTTLHQLLRRRELRLGEALDVVAQVADALDYSHALGVVHRDVKPENVMVSRGIDGSLRARVMDFGLALASAVERLTKTGHLPGTLAYLSPEQVLSQEVDGRSDLYSLATILYECLSGEPPFGGNPHAVLYRIVHETPRALSPRGIDPALEEIVLAALAKDPERRPARGRELAASLYAYRAGLSAVDDETLGGIAPRSRDEAPLVGRVRELDELRRRLDAALAGSLQLVLLGGEAGTGKTRLVAELATLARLRGVAVLRARWAEGDSAFPYQGFADLVPDAFREAGAVAPPELADLLPDLLGLFPTLAELPELRRPAGETRAGEGRGDLTARGDKTWIFELLARLVGRLTRGEAAVVVFEGLETATESLDALAYMARRLGTSPLLVIGTYRPPGSPGRTAFSSLATAFEGDPRFASLVLGPLAPDEHRQLLRALLGDPTEEGEPSRDAAAEIYEATDGNPFFTLELVRSLRPSTSSSAARPGWGGLAVSPLPATVQQVVEARIERLGDELRRLLATASVLGRAFEHDALAHLWGGDVEVLVERLMHDGLLEDDRRSRGDRVAFVSGVVRDAVYAAIPRRRRRALHRAHAEWLESRAAGRLDRVVPQLVHHFAAGDVADKTVAYATLHARQALAAASPEEAMRALRTALELAEVDDGAAPAPEVGEADAVTLGEVRLLLATALRQAGQLEPALAEAGRAAELLARAGEARTATRAAAAALLAVEVAWQGRRVDETRRWVERGLALATPVADRESRRRLLTYGATVANLAGESGRARRYLDEAERLAGGDDPHGEPPIGGSLVIALPEPIRALDPAAFASAEETEVLANVFEPLLRVDSAGHLVPGLAEAWVAGDDFASLELIVRAGIRFSDGAPLDPAAIRRSFERAARRGGDRPPAAIAALAGIEDAGEGRLRFRLSAPTPIFPAFLTDSRVAIVREAADGSLVGTGPFVVESAAPERVVLARNPGHWQAPPLLDRIELRAGLDAARIAAGLRSGELDLGRDLAPADLEALLREPRFRRGLVEATRKSVHFALWSSRGTLGSRPELRRALGGVLRLPDLVWRTLGRLAQPAAGWLPPGVLGHDPGRRRPSLPAAAATAALAGRPPRLRVVAHPLFHGRFAAFATALFDEWHELGVEVEVESLSIDAYLARWRDPGDADLLLGRWLGDYDDPDSYTFELLHSRHGLLAAWVEAGAADGLMEAARREADPGRRAALYRRLESRLAEDGAVVPLFHDVDYRLAAPGVEGLRLLANAPWVAYSQIGKRAAPPPVARASGGTLRVGFPGRCDSLDPALAVTADLAEIVPNVFEALTRFEEGAAVVPHLAEEVRLEAGATRLGVRLRDGVSFHDGRRLTAADVRASFERLLRSPLEAATLALRPVRGARELREGRASELAGVHVLSPLELEIELAEPCPLFPAMLSHPATAIVPEGAEVPGRFSGNWRQGCAGTGPFRLVRLLRGERVELEANPLYRRPGLPRADHLVFELGLDSAGRAAALRDGRLGLVGHLRAIEAEALWAAPELAGGYVEAPGFSTYYLVLACHRGPLVETSRRQSLAAAVCAELDRSSFGRLLIRARSIVPPGLLGHEEAETAAAEPEPAALAGVELRASLHPVFFGVHAAVWAAVARAAEALGATVLGRERRPEDLGDEVISGAAEVFAVRWFADFPDSDTFFARFHSRDGDLGALCGDPATDVRIEAARRETDPAIRHALYRELENLFAGEARVVPLFHEQSYRFAAPGLDGVRLRFRWPEVAYEEIALGMGDRRDATGIP